MTPQRIVNELAETAARERHRSAWKTCFGPIFVGRKISGRNMNTGAMAPTSAQNFSAINISAEFL